MGGRVFRGFVGVLLHSTNVNKRVLVQSNLQDRRYVVGWHRRSNGTKAVERLGDQWWVHENRVGSLILAQRKGKDKRRSMQEKSRSKIER